MPGSTIRSLVLTEIDKLADDEKGSSTKLWPAIAKGIYNYFSDSGNRTFTSIASGVITTPVPPFAVPGVGPVEPSLVVPPGELMLPNLQLLSVGNIPGFFNALAIWMNAPPWPVTIGKKATDVVFGPGVTGATVLTFPTIATLGASCQATMLAAKPSSREDAWDIIGNFIYTGASTNVVLPAPTADPVTVTPPGVFAGVTTSVLVWS